MSETHHETDKAGAEQGPTTRRGMIKNQGKLALALGVTLLSAQTAKAAPRPPCFLRGTKLLTTDGERCVEDIAVGDSLVTASGAVRAVEWVGCWQVRKAADRSWSNDVRPVRIRQSALAPNVPHTDLYVTQGHAMLLDGVLIPAGELVNGTSITIDDAEGVQELEYFHIRLASHDVIMACGAASETLLADAASIADFGVSQPATPDTLCAPVVCKSTLGTMAVRARRLATPLLGPQKLDVIRARLNSQAQAIGLAD